MNTEAEIAQFVAERIPISARRYLDVAAITHCESRVAYDAITDALVVELRAFLYALPRKRIQISRQWPVDWWQAVKNRWFPKWAKAYWPVRYERIDIDEPVFAAVCPHIQLDPPKTHLRWMAVKGDELMRGLE